MRETSSIVCGKEEDTKKIQAQDRRATPEMMEGKKKKYRYAGNPGRKIQSQLLS
jgi:hypothetical protein